jgi:hypothetical protein
VPVLYKTDLAKIVDEEGFYHLEYIDPDTEDVFFYIGEETIDGTTYDK